MSFRRVSGALALGLSLTVGCWSDLDDYSTENVPMTNLARQDWRDEIIYQVLIDRFEDGDTSNDVRIDRSALGRYQGGDWQGVINRMSYFKELGVTTLWISPIVRNVDHDAGFDAYHGYWASDLTRLNPHFGDLATLRRMVRVAHENNIKVILDIVTNHMGQMFYYDVNNNGRPDEYVEGSGASDSTTQYRNPGGMPSPLRRTTEYDPDFNDRGAVQAFTSLGPAGDAPIVFLNIPELFRVPPPADILPSQLILARPEGYHRRGRITSYDMDMFDTEAPGRQTLLGDFPGGLKDVNTEDPRVRTAMFEAYWRWVQLLDLDGFRIDTLKHVERGFWQDFAPRIRRAAMRAGKRNFFMFGEAFDGRDQLVGSYTQPNEMDSVFYFPQKYRIFDNIFQCGAGDTSDVERLYSERQMNYNRTPQPNGVGVAPSQLLVNFMDNHDVSRFLYGMNPTVVANILAGDRRDCTSGILNSHTPADINRFRPRLHAALTYLLMEDGIPCIYYGTEQEFHGGNDPSNRERMWETGFDTTNATFRHVRALTTLRQKYPALRRGTFAVRWTTRNTGTEQDAGMLAFERVDGNNYALVVIHAKDGTAETANGSTAMMVAAAPGTELVNQLGGMPRTVTVGSNGTVTVSLGAWQSAVFIPRSQVR